MKWLLTILLFALSACDSDAPPTSGDQVTQWTIGPVIKGKNYSVGMPSHPTACPPALFCIDLPGGPAVHAHYVTFRHGSLAGKTQIRMRYRVEMGPGVVIEPRTAPGSPSIVTLYFQRAGDDWSADGKYETFRWYAGFASQSPITVGEHEIVAPFTGNWTATLTSSRESAPQQFAVALANADQVGFVLGGGDGLGHGVYSTGPARIVVTEFTVE